MKDEFKGNVVCKFVGLNSKMYSSKDVDNEENKKQNELIKKLIKT